MAITVDELVRQAEQLSPADQAILADRILELLIPRDPEWEAAWTQECLRRIAEYERGETTAIDSDEVFANLKQKYGWQ